MDEHSLGQKLAAEFVGTGLLVFVGAGSVPAMILLTSEGAPFSGAEVGMIALAFGLIVTAMVYTVGKVSGCHINPAVTFALAATRRFPWSGVPAYWAAQVAGAIGGALAIWASFGSRVFDFGSGFGVVDFNNDVTAWGSAMFVEALATGILMFTILGIVDTRSPEGWAGLVIGLVVVAIIITVGPLTSASINPARALGPLLVSDLNGSFHNWIEQLFAYIPANLGGAAIAAFAYDWIAKPRIVQRPIKEAVTEPDRADAYEPAANV
ncbi:MAG: aquaporin family protein [Actinobacteria bacterium]|nr:aquaporin family protein [Actinomycetota bacterium]